MDAHQMLKWVLEVTNEQYHGKMQCFYAAADEAGLEVTIQ